jgi:hypothetical protein
MSSDISASPYQNRPVEEWAAVTNVLLRQHPLTGKELANVTLSAWKDIFATTIGSRQFRLGIDVKPQPQIMGFLLHELIPLELSQRYPSTWRRQNHKTEKDIVYTQDPRFSIEIKTSSSPKYIFANRSYAQPSSSFGRKGKFGYYLTVNFEKFTQSEQPQILLIRFGWLDHEDWSAQKAATGQQARLRPEAYAHKLRIIYDYKNFRSI